MCIVPSVAQPHTLDMDQYDNVLKEYDAVVLSGISSENTFGLVDASSLLWRLEVRVCVSMRLG